MYNVIEGHEGQRNLKTTNWGWGAWRYYVGGLKQSIWILNHS